MSVINTNVKSLVSQNALTVNNRLLGKTMEQLSTGKRINSAADDAAGLAISSRMTAQIKGLNQAVRNANDGISLLQTAEGAMVEVTNMLQRMRELAVQSANDTNMQPDRSYLDAEFQQLKAEIDRTSKTTQWNGTNILDGSYQSGTFTFQIGANNVTGQTISHTINSLAARSAAATTATTATTAGGSAAQVSTVTIGGTATVGDILSVTVNGKSYEYTVSNADVNGGGTAANNIASSLKTFLESQSDIAPTVTVGTNVVTLTGAAATPFSISSTSYGAGLAIAGSSAVGDITTRANSQSALTTLDSAITAVNQNRAGLGAVINRLTYAADNMSQTAMNAAASRSRVLDTDYASATTELARSQIIQQAATAMLAQANQQPQSVLSLLK